MKRARATPRRRTSAAGETTWEGALAAFLVHLADAEKSRHTRDHYRADIGTFATWWDEGRPGEVLMPAAIVEADLRDWKRWLKTRPLDRSTGRTRMPATVNAKLAALKSFLRWCAKRGIIPAPPEAPRRERLGDKRVKWLTEVEERRLIRALEGSKRHRDGRNLPMVRVMIGTGLRVAELVALEWRDVTVSERKGDVTVRAGKGCKPRVVPIGQTTRQAFRRLRDLAGGDPKPTDAVFYSQRGDRLTEHGVWDALRPFGVHPHQLRHTFGMRHQKAGTPLPVIAQLMGHSSIVTTMQSYGTPSEPDVRAAVESIDRGDDEE